MNKTGLHIALVANTTWNIYNFRLNLLTALIEHGNRITVIAPVDEYIHYLNEMPGVHHIPLRNLSRKSTNPVGDLRLIGELRTIYKRLQPDLILHFTIKPNIWGNLCAKSLGIPSFCVVTGLGYTFLHQGWIQMITRQMYKWSFHQAEQVLFENEDDRKLFVASGLCRAEQSKTVNGCGVDTSRFTPEPRPSYDQPIIYLFVGRLLYDKGIVEFVQAAKQVKKVHPRAQFWVLGEIDEDNPSFISKDQLVLWIKEKIIHYFGTSQQVIDYLHQASCVVLPSYREGLSKVLLEALSCGKPIITTDTPGCRQTVSHGKNGFLVPVKNADALALAMEAFHGLSVKEKEQMARTSRSMAIEKFDDAVVVEQYLQLIQKARLLPQHQS